ncbi:MAG: purine-binding chemotaxis protein CheW [Bacteroidales bacterium]|nr:purine-binding chemotaxis protein CheW [Bacteroidales bacterium]
MLDEEELLKFRARELAIQDQDQFSDAGTRKEMLVFLLSGEHYAIETSYITEALNIQEMTPIPGMPEYLNGVMNVRGRIIPVVNLKKFYSLKEEGLIASTKAIILREETYEVAIMTDAILPTQWIAEASIKPSPSNLHGVGIEHLLGVTEDALIVLDGNSLINKLQASLTNRK